MRKRCSVGNKSEYSSIFSLGGAADVANTNFLLQPAVQLDLSQKL